jgi:hypothetical protein
LSPASDVQYVLDCHISGNLTGFGVDIYPAASTKDQPKPRPDRLIGRKNVAKTIFCTTRDIFPRERHRPSSPLHRNYRALRAGHRLHSAAQPRRSGVMRGQHTHRTALTGGQEFIYLRPKCGPFPPAQRKAGTARAGLEVKIGF